MEFVVDAAMEAKVASVDRIGEVLDATMRERDTLAVLLRLAAVKLMAERSRVIEECAKVCDEFDPYDDGSDRARFDPYKSGADAASTTLADAIRALKAKDQGND
jgi:hypothetical protein